MQFGLKRDRHEGDNHFITISCNRREPCFNTPSSRDTFLNLLEQARASGTH
jgi:putative transposase